jgi:hypothetical protein
VRVQVGALSRALAVATLRLELEYIAGTLEDEALDIAAGTLAPSFMLSRQVGGPWTGPVQGVPSFGSPSWQSHVQAVLLSVHGIPCHSLAGLVSMGPVRVCEYIIPVGAMHMYHPACCRNTHS